MQIKLDLDVQEIQLVVNALAELPMKVVESLVIKIREQVTPQVQAVSIPEKQTIVGEPTNG